MKALDFVTGLLVVGGLNWATRLPALVSGERRDARAAAA